MRRALAAPLATVATFAAATAAAPAATLETTTTSYATIGGDPGAAYSRLDEESPLPGTAAASFGPGALAALGREFAYNDPQAGVESGAEGRLQDRNVELLLPDPRKR